jgi:hypothetical protein
MTADIKSYLCVGGPHSGRLVAQKHDSFYVQSTDAPLKLNEPWSKDSEITVATIEYRRCYFSTPQGLISFWTPSDQTPLQTLNLLLETYQDACKKV